MSTTRSDTAHGNPPISPGLGAVYAAAASSGRRTIEARFRLTSVARQQMWGQPEEGQTPIMLTVHMEAARHGVFGKATPSGHVDMHIVNPPAAILLDEAQLEALKARGRVPTFRVFFVEETAEETAEHEGG